MSAQGKKGRKEGFGFWASALLVQPGLFATKNKTQLHCTAAGTFEDIQKLKVSPIYSVFAQAAFLTKAFLASYTSTSHQSVTLENWCRLDRRCVNLCCSCYPLIAFTCSCLLKKPWSHLKRAFKPLSNSLREESTNWTSWTNWHRPNAAFHWQQQQKTLLITPCSEKQNRSNINNCWPITLCTVWVHALCFEDVKMFPRQSWESSTQHYVGERFNMPTCRAESKCKWLTPFADWLMLLSQELKTTSQPQIANTVTTCMPSSGIEALEITRGDVLQHFFYLPISCR